MSTKKINNVSYYRLLFTVGFVAEHVDEVQKQNEIQATKSLNMDNYFRCYKLGGN